MDNFTNNGSFSNEPNQGNQNPSGFEATEQNTPKQSNPEQNGANYSADPSSGFSGSTGHENTAGGGYSADKNAYGGQSYGYNTSPNTGAGGQYTPGRPNTQRASFDASGVNPEHGGSQYGSYRPFEEPTANAHKKKNKKGNTGKIVFAVLVCICIVVASVGIGSALSGNSKVNSDGNTNATDDAGNASSNAAVPGVEQSPVSASEYSGSGSMTAEQVYEAVKDINVGIVVYSNNQKAGEGSGIIVGADSSNTYTYILTAAHVISSDYSVIVKFDDETELDAQIVGYDTKTDVGVLKVKKTGFKGATFGDSEKLAVGQTVYAIGNPGGSQFFGTFTDGRVTAIDRPVSTSSTSAYDLPCIQHNAAINPGNSGGALVNEFGQVIGLNSSKIADTDYEGMGFSVPINTVLAIYNDIVSHGYVTNRPMLGITYYAVSSDYTYSAIAWKNNLPYGSVVIKTINQNSDLANKNVQSGDIITAVNGTNLDSTDILLDAIENSKVGDTLTLSICRLNNNGSVNTTFDVKVSLVEDKGDNTVTEEQTTENDFNSYFPFGY